MKTSMELPDELYRRVKSKSALEGRAVRDVAIELFTKWVDAGHPASVREHAVPAESRARESASLDWSAEWQRLGAAVEQAMADAPGLLEQLHDDRR